jgi:hypothetical protein
MTEDRADSPAVGHPPQAAVAEPAAADQPPASVPPDTRSTGGARFAVSLWLAGTLVLLTGGVALSPFWAPAVMPLLPWGAKPAAGDYDALAARVAALEQRPAPLATDVDAIKSAQAKLAQRVTEMEAAVAAARQRQGTEETTKTALAQLTQRLDAVEAQSTARAAADTNEIRKIQQDLAQRSSASGDLEQRLAALQRQVQARSDADRTNSLRLLALLQMREAVEQARPFPDEYAAFKATAAGDADLTAAAAALADAARDGVASRTVLRQRLADLAAQFASSNTPATEPQWWGQMLDRLRGLVTIRRIGGGEKSATEAAVANAQSALAGGDLAAAINALDKLTGADRETALPWLRMARRRLAAEAALSHLQELLTTHLGAAPPTAAPTPTPSAAPPPAPSRTPS